MKARHERAASGRLRATTLLSVLLLANSAFATIVERVVAVVGEHPILLSELKSRTKPFESQLGGAPSERAAQRSQLFSQMLDRMVDEELMRRAASQAKVTVTNEEVDAAIERVAAGNAVTVEELMVEIERSGVDRTQYRRELRGQLLDAKVMNVRVQGRIQVSPDDAHREYQQLLMDERKLLPVQLAAIRFQVPTNASPEEASEIERLAATVAQRARAGEPFEELAKRYSSDPAVGETHGLLPQVSPNQMPEELALAVLPLEVGSVSKPIKSQETWVVLKLIDRAPSSLPPYAQAEMQLVQRVQMRKMEVARRRWLDDMRKRTHVEIRL